MNVFIRYRSFKSMKALEIRIGGDAIISIIPSGWREQNGFLKTKSEPEKETSTKSKSTVIDDKVRERRGPMKYFNFDKENISYPITCIYIILGKNSASTKRCFYTNL